MTSSALGNWEDELRKAVRREFRLGGFTVRNMRGKVYLRKIWADKTSASVTLPIEWREGVQLEVLKAIETINGHLQKGLSLKEAVALISPAAPGTQRRSVGPNWTDAAERFQAHKINSGQVKPSNWQKNYAGRIESALKLLALSSGPTTGKALLQKLATGEPGSRGRVVRVEYVAQFLRFAVAEVGVDERWAPPSSDVLADIKGRAVPNQAPDLSKGQGQAVPINDAAFLELYDSIPDARWKLAVGLMGVFGLRPVELNYIRTEGKALRCSFVKRTARGQTKPRLIEALDPVERPGMGQQLLLELSSGLTGLPPLGSDDKAAASAVSTYLNRRASWKRLRKEAEAAGLGALRGYSFRHGFAYRSAMTYNLPIRAAAALMGHSVQTHLQHYGKWVDAAGVKDAVAAARAKALKA